MSETSRLLVLWSLATVAGFAYALSGLPAAYDGASWYPVGEDSFYHARRILDTLADPEAFYEFDPRIHAPDGSLLTWPWAYNRLAAEFVRGVLWLAPQFPPMAVLACLPVVAVGVNTALVLMLGWLLRLPWWCLALLAACYSTSPLTRELHAVGRIDHHFLEHAFFVASLLAGMWWLRSGHRLAAVVTGTVLGVAPAFHNGLFVLQAFLLATLFVLWLRGRLAASDSAVAFCGALLLATLVVLLPSAAFQRFEWSFYYLGWFHLAAACLSAGATMIMMRMPPGPRAWIMLFGLGIVPAVLAWNQIAHGGRFVVAALPMFDQVAETTSILDALARDGVSAVTARYSGLLWIMPLVWPALLVAALTLRDRAQVLLAVTLAIGSLLALQQLRLHVFGSLALMLPPLLIAAAIHRRLERRRAWFALATTLVMFAAIIPSAGTFGRHPPLAGDANYARQRALLVRLGEHCAREPGTVLARFLDGHYLRYHTDCAVIANNMIITPQHFERVAYSETLLAESAAALRRRRPPIQYVYLWRQDNVWPGLDDAAARAANPPLAHELLLADTLPAGYDNLGEVALETDAGRVVIARILRLRPLPER